MDARERYDRKQTRVVVSHLAHRSTLAESAGKERRALETIVRYAFIDVASAVAFCLGVGWAAAMVIQQSSLPAAALSIIASWVIASILSRRSAQRTGRTAAGIVADVAEMELSDDVVMAAYDLLLPGRALQFLMRLVILALWLTAFVLSWRANGSRAILYLVMMYLCWRGLGRATISTCEMAFRRESQSPQARLDVHPLLGAEMERYRLKQRPRWVPRAPYHKELVGGIVVAFLAVWAVMSPTALRSAYVGGVIIVWIASLLLTPFEARRGDLAECRAARAPALSRYLAVHSVLNFILDAAWLLFGVMAFVQAPDWASLASVAVLAFATTMLVVPWTLTAMKALVTGSFKIVVFRRFDVERAPQHRQIVLPVLGAFGTVVALSDPTLQSAQPSPLQTTEEALSRISDLQRAGANWLEHVRQALRDTDLVVFDWPGLPTQNMITELDATLEFVPVERMIWITPIEGENMVKRWLCDRSTNATILSLSDTTTLGELAKAIFDVVRRFQRAPRPAVTREDVGGKI